MQTLWLPHRAQLTRLSLISVCCLLPRANTESPAFQTFDEARQAIEALVPSRSGLAELTERRLSPDKQPNTAILTQADIVRRVFNGGVLGKDDLDLGIVTCINARNACRGWVLNVARITKARTGNFFADFANFKRRTETTGWRFNALILLVNNNPLGPVQDMGPSTITNAR